MNIEELSQQDSREIGNFDDFRLIDENASDALADIRQGRGIHHDSGNDFASFDDDEIDLSEYVPAWA